MKKILEQELEKIKISEQGEEYLESIAKKVIDKLGKKIKKKNINASIFVGGSLAKNTIIRKKKHDIDLFLRFDKKYSEEEIKKLFKKLFFWFRVKGERMKVRRLHGSRDYYKILFKRSNVVVEVVPSVKVSKPEKARNLTDLSYFHVNYIKKQMRENKKLGDEIRLAKSFCHGQNCYGAESYIRGLSGYAVELLVSHYKSFKKFLTEISKADGKIVLDPGKHYKNRDDIFKNLNPTKTKSPIILIDPTFKERNAARALSKETFKKLQNAAKKFLKNPSEEFFEPKKVNLLEFRTKARDEKGIFAVFEIKTNKQPGDIAGTKLFKFSKLLLKEIKKFYDVVKFQFDYLGFKKSRVYFVLKKKKEIILLGPEIHRKKAVANFKKKHPIWYVEEGRVKSNRATDTPIRKFLKFFKKSHKRTMKQMAIKKVRIV